VGIDVRTHPTVVLVPLGAYWTSSLLDVIEDIRAQNLLPGHPLPAAMFRHASEAIINDRRANPRAVGRSILEICPLRPPFRDRSCAAHGCSAFSRRRNSLCLWLRMISCLFGGAFRMRA
jgi:hypothetical protein